MRGLLVDFERPSAQSFESLLALIFDLGELAGRLLLLLSQLILAVFRVGLANRADGPARFFEIGFELRLMGGEVFVGLLLD